MKAVILTAALLLATSAQAQSIYNICPNDNPSITVDCTTVTIGEISTQTCRVVPDYTCTEIWQMKAEIDKMIAEKRKREQKLWWQVWK